MSHSQLPCPDCSGLRDSRAARCTGCHLTAVRKAAGSCVDCGATIRRDSERCNPCAQLARRAPRVLSSGYIAVWRPEHPLAMRDGYVLEHRMVVYDAGIGNKQDNRLSNLQVLLAVEHHRMHAAERAAVLEIAA